MTPPSAQPVEVQISLGQLDAVHGDTPPGQRYRDTPGADAQFQCGPALSQAGEEVHRRVDDGRVEQFRPQPLVPGRHPLVEVRR